MEAQPGERKPRVLSGIQPTGQLHLGNYLGAIRQWAKAQDEKDCFYCVVDLHAITVPQDPAELRASTRGVVALLLAAGLDPERCTLFVQSHVRAHAECSWLLSCVTPLGWLERMVQYKTKAQRQESVQTGLLTYPVLQAGDILLYHADEVPVGEDQKQHVELTRDIAQRFNHQFGEVLTLPRTVMPAAGARIMGLDDPTNKMSKSLDISGGHAVRLTDPDKRIEKAIKRAVTDSGNEIVFSDDPEKAGVNNLLTIYQALTDQTQEAVLADFADARGYGDLKKRVAEVTIEALRPIREEYEHLMSDLAELDRQLSIGADRAGEIAEATVLSMKDAMGFLIPG